MVNIQTLKGFRDFLPQEARKRQYVINILRQTFESFGFEPLETPALEYEEVLLGKYGEEGDKLMYRFTDNGERRVALRYDQTVPLARVVSQYQNTLPIPFKRYQIQNVWRAENTQKGRFREFLQCDIDAIGVSSTTADAEIIAVVDKCLKMLGFDKYQIKINDRKLLFSKIKEAGVSEDLSVKVIREIDKVDKIGWSKLKGNLIAFGLSEDVTARLDTELSITQSIEQKPYLGSIIESAESLGVNSKSIVQKLYLARGLDYYTGLIIEVEVDGYEAGSVGGGGRYDNLVGMFSKTQVPAVGFAFGFDRIMEAMEQMDLFPKDLTTTSKVLVTVFNSELADKSTEIANILRKNVINTELWLDPEVKLEKQLKYADQKSIPFAVIIGPTEIQNNQVVLKNLKDRTQETLTFDEVVDRIKD